MRIIRLKVKWTADAVGLVQPVYTPLLGKQSQNV